ncbi:TonB-dependent receptor [Acidobacteria bacterium AH-259-L09]|nr:TonB-dependent receptor [Acidobacteria bacterium AH-259-L09]
MLSVALMLVVVGVVTPSWAQRTTGSLGGVVQDETGGVLPGVDVTVSNEATGVVRSAVTTETGFFVVPSLPPGSYTLKIEMPGFRTYEQTNLIVESAQDVRRTFVLQVGQVSETITVQGGATMVDTVGSEQRGGLAEIQIQTLPNINRNITNLLMLNPAVTVVSGRGNRFARLNGTGIHGTVYTMDGIEASGYSEGNLISLYSGRNNIDLISIEGIQEVQIIKGVLPAEYGNTVSGQVNIITKAGTSEIHGSVFHLYETQGLNAQHPFLSSKPKVVYNQFGGSVGFPIIRRGLGIFDQAFGFLAYEGYEERRGLVRRQDVPTQLARDQALASPNFDDREKQILQLIFAPLPFPNNPSGDPLGGLFRTARPLEAEDDTFLFKGDVHFVDESHLAFTWNRLDPSFNRPAVVAEGDRRWLDNSNRLAGSWDKSTGRWVFESRFGYSRITQFRSERFFDEQRDPVLPERAPFGRRLPWVRTDSFSTLRGEVLTSDADVYNIDQKIGYIGGNHHVKFGGSYRYKAGNWTNPEVPRLLFNTTDDFLANRLRRVLYTFGAPNHNGRMFQFGFFLQDDWRVRPKLTLNLGLRYDFISNFTASRRDGGDLPTGDREVTFFNSTPPQNWALFDFGPPLPPSKPFKHDPLNLAPRFGFNFNPDGEGRTVIRGGFGMMFASDIIGSFRRGVGEPLVPSRVAFSGGEIDELGLRLGVLNEDARQIVIPRATAEIFNPSSYNPFLDAPYSMNYTLGIQREIVPDTVLEIDYVGQRGVHFMLERAVNEPDRTTSLRPNPKLGGGFYMDDSQQSVYSALQVSLRKRFTGNLAYGVTYAYGRGLATSGADTATGGVRDNGVCCQEFFNPKLARGRTPADIEHNFTSNWYYRLPRPSGGAARNVLGGWTFSGIFRAQTGTPIGVRQNGGRFINRADVVDLDRARLDDFADTLQFWNPDAFAKVPLNDQGIPIRPGNANRSLISGPGFWTMDVSFGKDFKLMEDVTLRFRWDWMNAFNHVNTGGPRSNLSRSRFGSIEGIAGGMRISQLNLKILF